MLANEPERPLPDDIGVEELARLLSLTARRLSMLAAEGIIPKAKRGRYPFIASVQGYVRYLKEAAGEGVNNDSLTKQRARLTRSKADIAELQRSRLMGEVIPANEVVAMNTSIASTVRTKLLTVPTKYAARLTMIKKPADAETILRSGIEEALEDLARLGVAPAERTPGGRARRRDHAEDIPATAEADDF
jgi:phage terminase Nu1 subunit (DNA packaging protein)